MARTIGIYVHDDVDDDNGRIVSRAGISAGIDMPLHLVERLAGRELALPAARQMAYDWNQA